MKYLLADLTGIERLDNNYVLNFCNELIKEDDTQIIPFIRHTEVESKTQYFGFDSSSIFKRELKVKGLCYLQQFFLSIGTNLYMFPESLFVALETIIKHFGEHYHYVYIGCTREMKVEIESTNQGIKDMEKVYNLTSYIFNSANILYVNEWDIEITPTHPFSYFDKILMSRDSIGVVRDYDLHQLPFIKNVKVIHFNNVKSIDLTNSHKPVNLNQQARKELNNFLYNGLKDYKSTRNKLLSSTSKLSKYFAIGAYSYSEVFEVLQDYVNSEATIPIESLDSFLRQLNWTIFFKTLMSLYGLEEFGLTPDNTARYKQSIPITFLNHNSSRDNNIIRVIKKELESTGYISNRSRMILTCYLINSLEISPILVGEYLQSLFIDYNAPVHWCSILWCTGVLDSQIRGSKSAYISEQIVGRRFNLTKQQSLNSEYLQLHH